MKSFLEWFRGSTKVKRWMFLILLGVVLTCYAFTNTGCMRCIEGYYLKDGLHSKFLAGFYALMAIFSYIIIAVLIASIAVKCGLFFYNRAVAKKINSDILKATAVDCLSDCISTAVVLIAIIIGKLTGFNIDGYALKEFENKVADYFELISTDKRKISLKNI